jgi:hypothetical protein
VAFVDVAIAEAREVVVEIVEAVSMFEVGTSSVLVFV